MTLSRKEFFRQGFFSLGETFLKAGGSLWEMRDSPGPSPADGEQDREPVPDLNTLAVVDNRHCPAKHCGCFSCLERCAARAISLVMGTGIRIDQALCSGCGICEYVCPVTPKAIKMVRKSL